MLLIGFPSEDVTKVRTTHPSMNYVIYIFNSRIYIIIQLSSIGIIIMSIDIVITLIPNQSMNHREKKESRGKYID